MNKQAQTAHALHRFAIIRPPGCPMQDFAPAEAGKPNTAKASRFEACAQSGAWITRGWMLRVVSPEDTQSSPSWMVQPRSILRSARAARALESSEDRASTR